MMCSADNVIKGDVMVRRDGKRVVVTEVRDLIIYKKVNVETETGMFYANGTLTTGICEYGPTQAADAATVLSHWRWTHFGTGLCGGVSLVDDEDEAKTAEAEAASSSRYAKQPSPRTPGRSGERRRSIGEVVRGLFSSAPAAATVL